MYHHHYSHSSTKPHLPPVPPVPISPFLKLKFSNTLFPEKFIKRLNNLIIGLIDKRNRNDFVGL